MPCFFMLLLSLSSGGDSCGPEADDASPYSTRPAVFPVGTIVANVTGTPSSSATQA